MKPSPKITQAVEVAFSLKENSQHLNFITMVNLKDSGLAPIEGPQLAFSASLTMTMPPPADDTSFKAAMVSQVNLVSFNLPFYSLILFINLVFSLLSLCAN